MNTESLVLRFGGFSYKGEVSPMSDKQCLCQTLSWVLLVPCTLLGAPAPLHTPPLCGPQGLVLLGSSGQP